jgi:hypothetical protein
MKKMCFSALLLCLLSGPSFAQYSPTDPISGASVVLSNAATSSSLVSWPGGIGVFSAVGTWNGATLTLEFIGPDGVTLVPAGTATTMTANGAWTFYLPKCLLKAVMSGAGGSTSLTASIALVQSGR